MTENITEVGVDTTPVNPIYAELTENDSSRSQRIAEKFMIAALGSIPWVGGFIAATASIRGDEASVKGDDLRTQWLLEHHRKLEQLKKDLDDIAASFKNVGKEIEDRIQQPEYLALVRQAFRTWDSSETDEKRRYIAKLLSNAAGTRICSDDVLRLFISWLNQYDETHFAVIREISKNPASTRYDIWSELYGENLPREDSAEADLYRLLIRDLSTGGVIRQARDKTEAGQFLRQRQPRHRRSGSPVMKSAFDDKEQYLLTDLGRQFVHYTMNEVVPRFQATPS